MELWEKSNRLGGTLVAGCQIQRSSGQICRIFKDTLYKRNVKVRLNKTATTEEILKKTRMQSHGGPNLLSRKFPAGKMHVVEATQMCCKATARRKIVVLGGGLVV